MSSLTRKQVQELLPLFVLGELAGDEQRQVEVALAADQALREEADEWRERCGEMLASSAPAIDLSSDELDHLWGGLDRAIKDQQAEDMAAVESPAPFQPIATGDQVQSNWMVPLALAASVLSLAVALWALSGRVNPEEMDNLRADRQAMASELVELREALQRTDREIDRVSLSLKTFGYPHSTPIVLAGLEPAPRATGKTFLRPDREQALFFAFGLPQLAAATTYQLWYITDQGPISAGTFAVDRFGEGELLVANVPAGADIDLWAVTLEPAGGSPQPTGEMLIRG